MPWWLDDEDEDEDLGYGGKEVENKTHIFFNGEKINGPVGDIEFTIDGSPERLALLAKRMPPVPSGCRHANPDPTKSCRSCSGYASFTAGQKMKHFCHNSSSIP